ncbi:MAG TPA: asparagine synthase (glutamine-hydrolyzing) [Thermoanaerobaculia bacterium]|nr:asparagine synthase (glutamine-hydrolyzing) [Thermoanaerobaculia bacterium]
MCGIAGIFGTEASRLDAMVGCLGHRGPDGRGVHSDPAGCAALGHTRLSIIDLSDDGLQPMSDPSGRWWIVFNGEIYNYLELRSELASSWEFRTKTDTEVLLAAYAVWGERCMERLIGMFVFLLWDARERRLFAARDRFGVKPLYVHEKDGALLVASEIKALHAAGVAARPDATAWASYLAHGLHDHSERTFWESVRALPPGHALTWQDGRTSVSPWYDLSCRVGPETDTRGDAEVREEYRALLEESVRLRFRSDVPVGINLSGGLDSSTLLGIVQQVQGPESDIQAFTFVTGDPLYDELPWVEQMLARTCHPLVVCGLTAEEVPALAESVARFEDEPFGGLPTLAYARLFERAREAGVVVLLDGQGMDEQWAGYDYYRATGGGTVSIIQGTRERSVRPECLTPELRARAERPELPSPFPDRLRNLQYRDIRYTKIPRALRFNDRISMRSSTELREPFLDHRLVELALRQPAERKIRGEQQKWMLRSLVCELLPKGVAEAPKRPLQTPQREWLRGPLRGWATEQVERALESGWLDADAVCREWQAYCAGEGDNSFFVWQWISLGLLRGDTEP